MFNRPRSLLTLVLLLAGTLLSRTNRKSEIVIIANPALKIDEISAEDLKAIFLRTKLFLKGSGHVEPVVETGGATHISFVKSYLGKTESALQTYYRSLVFSGQGNMPTLVKSDSEAVSYVEKTRGAIGYTDASAVTDHVKMVRVK